MTVLISLMSKRGIVYNNNKQIRTTVPPPPSSNNSDLEVGQGQDHGMVPIERVGRIMHAKYQCPIINTSEDMSRFNVCVTDRRRNEF